MRLTGCLNELYSHSIKKYLNNPNHATLISMNITPEIVAKETSLTKEVTMSTVYPWMAAYRTSDRLQDLEDLNVEPISPSLISKSPRIRSPPCRQSIE